MVIFKNRVDAGKRLAAALSHYADNKDAIVLALPRGGVPVAFEVCQTLHVPLDVFLVRKLGVPGHEELAMGAIAMGDVRVVNDEIVRQLGISAAVLDDVTRIKRTELEARNQRYRQARPAPQLTAKIIILVDDGIATGATIRAAIKAIKQQQPALIVIATPVAPVDTVATLQAEVDEVICLEVPEPFFAIGTWYEDFAQTTDEEVIDLLAFSTQAAEKDNGS